MPPDYPCPMHDALTGTLENVHRDVREILATMSSLTSLVAVQRSELTRVEKDVDAIWGELKEFSKSIDQRLKTIEGLIEQSKGAAKTIKILWGVTGSSLVLTLFTMAKEFWL